MPLARDDAGLVDQHRVGQLADPDRSCRPPARPRQGRPSSLCSATSRSCSARSPSPISTSQRWRRSLRTNERATPQQLLAHRAGRRDEQQQLALAVRALAAEHAACRPARSVDLEPAAPRSPTATARSVIRAPSGATRSCSTPIWRASARTTTLRREDHDDQHDLGDDQRLDHQLGASRAAGGPAAPAAQLGEGDVEQHRAARGGDDRDASRARSAPARQWRAGRASGGERDQHEVAADQSPADPLLAARRRNSRNRCRPGRAPD